MIRYFFLFFLLGQLLFAISDRALGVTIDLAGRQRMLTQRMAKEALLILLDNAAEANKKKLRQDLDLFDSTLKGLIQGDKKLGLVRVDNADIQRQLAYVSELFAPFKISAEAIVDGTATDADYNQVVLKKNMLLLQEMNKAVFMYTALTDQAENRSLKMGPNINLAGRQRMLTQRMAKDLLIAAMASPEDRAPYEKDFAESRALFDRTLKGLLDGDEALHLVRTTLPNIRDQLEKVQALWQLTQRTFQHAVDDPNTLNHAVESLDRLMNEMNLIFIPARSFDKSFAGDSHPLSMRMLKRKILCANWSISQVNSGCLLSGSPSFLFSVHWECSGQKAVLHWRHTVQSMPGHWYCLSKAMLTKLFRRPEIRMHWHRSKRS